MKIKNLAFFGIMAAIMGVAGTARADTTTVIASQAYVDAKDDLKQNLLKSGDNGNVVVSGSGNVVTGITADGQGTVTVTKGNVDVSAAVHDGIRDNQTTTAPSENAVYDAITGMTDTQGNASSATDKAVTKVTESRGAVTVESGQLTGNAVTYNEGTQYNEGTIGKKVQEIANTAGSAIQTITEGATNGTIAVDGTDVSVHGLGSAAYVTKGANTADTTANSLVNVDANGFVTGTATAGALAKKDTIADADVASNAAIAKSKINFSQAELDALDSGITSAKVSNYDTTKTTVDSATGDNVVATRTANTNLLKGSGLQNAVAHLKGNGAENYTANVDNSNAENSGIKNETVSSAAKTAWDATLTAKEGDNYLTTLAAVERRVQEAEANATSGITSATDNTASASTAQDATTLTIVAAGNDGNQTTKLATSHAVAQGFTAVNTAIGNMALSGATTTNTAADDAVTAVSQTNGKLSASKGKLTAAALDSTAKSTSIPSSGAVDTKLATEKAVADALSSSSRQSDWTQTTTTAPDYIKNKPTLGALAAKDKIGNNDVTANSLVYKDAMNYQLSNVNDQGGDGSSKCLKGSPCTLTMFMNGSTPVYEWTNMDTESTDAVI